MVRGGAGNPIRSPSVWAVSIGVHGVAVFVGAIVVVGAALGQAPSVTRVELRLAPVTAAPPPPPPSSPDSPSLPPAVPPTTVDTPPSPMATDASPAPPPDALLVAPPMAGANVLTTTPIDASVELATMAPPAGPAGWGVAGGIAGGPGDGATFQQPIPAPSAVPPPAEPPPPATPTEPVRVGGAIDPPALVHFVEPDYPQVALWAGRHGGVGLELRVRADGTVEDAVVVRPLDPLLDDAALDATRRWRYEPLLLNGRPFPFLVEVTVNFALQRRR